MEKTRIALAGLKGGIGKTTLSMVLGSILQETYNKRVCYVDADHFQYPISAQNQREQIFYSRQPDLAKDIFAKRGLDFDQRHDTAIFRMQDDFELQTMPEEVERTYPDFNIYIYDFMGSKGYDITYEYLTKMDYVILPTVIDAINARPTFYWFKGINFGIQMVTQRQEEVRLKKIFLLFNQFNEDNCDLALKATLEDQARLHHIITLQNCVRHFNGVSKDISCVDRGSQEFFVSTQLRPSESYLEETNVHQVAEELFLAAGIIEEPKVFPAPIDDPIEMHQTILKDLKEQLDEAQVLSGETKEAFSKLSDKYKEILETYQELCSMSVEEIYDMFGRKPRPVPITDEMVEPIAQEDKDTPTDENPEVAKGETKDEPTEEPQV